MRHYVSATGKNILPLAIVWLTAFALMRVSEFGGGGWAGSSVAIAVACALGVAISLRLRARAAALFIAAQLAYVISELAIHARYGIHAAQGAPTHFAVMGAG